MAEFKIPNIAEGISEVDLAALTVSVGDVIEPGMVVAEVETEKAATDIDCPIGGKVVKIHANPGDTMAVGAVLLTIEAVETAPAAPAERHRQLRPLSHQHRPNLFPKLRLLTLRQAGYGPPQRQSRQLAQPPVMIVLPRRLDRQLAGSHVNLESICTQ